MVDVRRQQGLSLVEMMIALVLGTLLVLGVVQLFVSNSQTYRLNEANARVQESGRMGLEILTRAVRNGAYYGCAPDRHEVREETVWTDGAQNGSPVLFVRGARYNRLELHEQSMTEAKLTMRVPEGRDGIDLALEMDRIADDTTEEDDAEGGTLLITDCNQAEIVDFRRRDGDTIILDQSLQNIYEDGASVYALTTDRYDIAVDSSGEPTLMRNDNALVSGIRAMALEFGFEQSEGVNWRSSADQQSGTDIRGLRISLLAQSDAINVVDDPMTLMFPAEPWSEAQSWSAENSVSGDDQRRLFRAYTGTVAIRNQVFRN